MADAREALQAFQQGDTQQFETILSQMPQGRATVLRRLAARRASRQDGVGAPATRRGVGETASTVSPARQQPRAGDSNLPVQPENESWMEDKAKFSAAIGATLVPFLTMIPEVGQFVERQRAENPTAFDVTSTLGQIGTSFIGGMGILSRAGFTAAKIADRIGKSGKAMSILQKAGLSAQSAGVAGRNVVEGLVQEALISAQQGRLPSPVELGVFAAVDAALPTAFRQFNLLRRKAAREGGEEALRNFDRDTVDAAAAAGRGDYGSAPDPSGPGYFGHVQGQSAGMFRIHPDTAEKFKRLDHDNYSTLDNEYRALFEIDGKRYEKARGGIQSFDEILARAEKYKGDVHEAMKTGKFTMRENADDLAAQLVAMRSGMQLLANMLANDRTLRGSEAFMSRFRNIANATLGTQGNIGRAQGANRIRFDYDRATAASLQELLEEEDEILTAIKLMTEKTNPTEVDKWLKKLAEVGRNFKLSSPGTVGRSFLGNAINSVMQFTDTLTHVGFDAMRSVLTGKARTRSLKEITARYLGYREAIPEAWDIGLKTLKEDPDALRQAGYVQTETGKLTGEIEAAWGKYLRAPQNIQGSIDAWFRIPAVKAEAMQRGVRNAIEEVNAGKLDRADIIKRAHELTNQWLQPGSTMRKHFEKKAAEIVFQAPIEGDLGKLVQRWRTGETKGAAVAQMLLPFFRTGYNIGVQTLQRTPLTWLTKSTRELWKRPGGKEDVLVKMANGLGFMGLTSAVLGNKLTGSGPMTDPAKRQQLFESGWQPNSVDIGDGTLVSYEGYGPISVLMSLLANQMEGNDIGEKGRKMADVLLKETAFYNIEEMMEIASPRSRKDMSTWGARVISGMLIPAVARQIGIGAHGGELQRRPDGFFEALSAEFGNVYSPIRLDPRISPTGEVAKQQNPFARMMGIKISQQDQDNLVAQELNRLDVTVGNPTSYFNVKLNKDQQNQLNALAGPMINSALTALIVSPSYQQQDDAMKKVILERFKSSVVNKSRKFFAGELL